MAEEKEMVGDVYYPSPEIIEHAHIKDYDAVNEAAMNDLARVLG